MVKDDILLVAGNLTSVSVDVAERGREDVVNSILFSQMYASSKVDKFASSQQWHKNYAEAMGQLKWKSGGYRYVEVEMVDNVLVVLKRLIRDKLSSMAGLSLVEQFERLMCNIQQECVAEAIASSTEDHAMVYKVEGEDSVVSTVTLHVSMVGAGPAIYSAFVCFKTTQEVKSGFFNQAFKSELVVGEIGIGISKLVLDKAGYEKARIREKVLDSLPEVTAPLVLNITPECDTQLR